MGSCTSSGYDELCCCANGVIGNEHDLFLTGVQMENDGRLSDFYDEINLVLQCKSVSVDGLTSEMNQLREGYSLVQSVALASSNASDDRAKLAQRAFAQFADDVDDTLRGVQTSLDLMNTSVSLRSYWIERACF